MPEQIEALARAFLLVTREPGLRQRFLRERVECRRLLRHTGRAGYGESADAEFDRDWLIDLFAAYRAS